MSVGKKILLSISILIIIAMLGTCLWWAYILLFGPEKIVRDTFMLGDLTTAAGSTLPICEIDYMSNANKNGYEKLEIKWNYFTDETRTHIYSQGQQYLADTMDGSISFQDLLVSESEKVDEERSHGWLIFGHEYRTALMKHVPTQGTSYYNYASQDNYNTIINSANPLTADSEYMITMDNDLYLMKFKGLDSPLEEFNLIMAYRSVWLDFEFYSFYDQDYFAYLMYQALQTDQYGKNGDFIFELPDMFDYYKYDGSTYQKVPAEENAKVHAKILNYFSIKVHISADGAQSAAEDSLFHMLHGSYTFNIKGSTETEDYFVGRSKIGLTLFDFDLVDIGDKYVALKLRNDFVKTYLPYKDSIVLNVVIDLDKLTEFGYRFYGFAEDHGLNAFTVEKVCTQKLEDGQVVLSEVQL